MVVVVVSAMTSPVWFTTTSLIPDPSSLVSLFSRATDRARARAFLSSARDIRSAAVGKTKGGIYEGREWDVMGRKKKSRRREGGREGWYIWEKRRRRGGGGEVMGRLWRGGGGKEREEEEGEEEVKSVYVAINLYVHLLIYPPIYLSTYLPTYLSVCLSMCVWCLPGGGAIHSRSPVSFISKYIHLSIYLSVYVCVVLTRRGCHPLEVPRLLHQ